jgi:hypothetical protein
VTVSRLAAIAGLLIGLVGLGIDLWEILPATMTVSEANPVARSLPDALIQFWTFFTHLTNLGLVLVYVAVLTGWRWLGWFRSPRTQAAMGGYILLVMLYYHFLLAGKYELQGGLLVATYILHYVAPLWYLGWWTLFRGHGELRWRDVPMMLVPGLAYVAWALLRGAVVGEYPYDIIDAGKFGYGVVATGVGSLIAAVTIFCLLLVAADKLFAHRQRAVG